VRIFVKILALVLIIVGVAGLALPIVPGILLISIGALLFFNDRLADIRRLLPEKMPAAAAVFYNWLALRFFRRFYAVIAGEVPLREDGFCLDVGTGPGMLPIEMSRRFPGANIFGIDASEKMVELARKNKEAFALSDNVKFGRMDANELCFPDCSFDMIVSTFSMHHWKAPVRVLNEIYRCLKPGGEAWIYDGCADAQHVNLLLKYILNINGYTKAEYAALIAAQIARSDFRTGTFEERGIMMRMRLKK
jgi:SAM-dependent methyltransferase